MKRPNLLAPADLSLKTLLGWIGLWSSVLFLGIDRLQDYHRQNYYIDYKYRVTVSGPGAAFSARALIVAGAVFLTLTCLRNRGHGNFPTPPS